MADQTFYNISNLLMQVTTTTATTTTATEPVIKIRNNTNIAYEWRFILPPYIVIFLLSIAGNCMVIATLASNRRMRTVTNVYLLNLAISDFLLGVFCLPFTIVGQIYRRFLFGSIMCKLIPFLQAVSVSVDVWTLVAISLERYFAICRPLKSRKWQTQGHAYKMIAVIWGLSLILNAPILIVSTLQRMRGNAYKCREEWPTLTLERSFNLTLDATLLLVPFFLMSFAYCLIVSKLWRGLRREIEHNATWQKQLRTYCSKDHPIFDSALIRNKKETMELSRNHIKDKSIVRSSNQNLLLDVAEDEPSCSTQTEINFARVVRHTNIDKSIEAKKKVIKMLFVIILEFFICWTPLHVVNTVYLFYPEDLYKVIGPKGIILLQLLAYCSSCCHPITYSFMNKKFRQAFIALFKHCGLARSCFRNKELNVDKNVTPAPSSQEITAGVKRCNTGRTGEGNRTDLSNDTNQTLYLTWDRLMAVYPSENAKQTSDGQQHH